MKFLHFFYFSGVCCVLVAQSCPTLCDPINGNPKSPLRGILQAEILEWVPFLFPGDLSNSGIEPLSPALQADSSLFEPPGKLISQVLGLVAQSCLTRCDPMDHNLPGSSVHGSSPGKNTGIGSHPLLQGIFPTQRSNPGLPHCR